MARYLSRVNRIRRYGQQPVREGFIRRAQAEADLMAGARDADAAAEPPRGHHALRLRLFEPPDHVIGGPLVPSVAEQAWPQVDDPVAVCFLAPAHREARVHAG